MGVWLCVCSPGGIWAETADQEEKTVIDLKDGTVIELTNTEILRKQPETEGRAETLIWSIPAKEPRLPLIFENREGLRLLLYYTVTGEHTGEFRAVRVEDGKEHWVHPIWFSKATDTITSPIFVKPWIYFGRMAWLEQMDPDNGKIVERYPARVIIKSLQPLSDGALEILSEDVNPPLKTILLRFEEGQFSPHIAAYGSLLAGLRLFSRSQLVMEGFGAASRPFEYNRYLDLHSIKEKPLPPEFVLQWRDFDLQETEQAYRRAYQQDPVNPYFAMYLALSLYYQNQRTEAEPYFQEALTGSETFWEESLRLGSICESLRLTMWADRFYEQGIARYFQEVQAPPDYAYLIEILVAFVSGPYQSSALFFHGHIDRALHVFEVRRQLFPYTEIDNWFSRKYARWLRQTGQKEKALAEEQRIGRLALFSDPVKPTAVSLTGFLMAGFFVLGVILVKNDARSRPEVIIVIIAIFVIGGIVLIPDAKVRWEFGREFDVSRLFAFPFIWKLALLMVTTAGYIGVIAFFRRRQLRNVTPGWTTLLNVTVSSYIVLLIGLFIAYLSGEYVFRIIAYLSGEYLSRAPAAGKVAELLFVCLFISLRRWVCRHPECRPSFRHFKVFIVVWAIVWCQLAGIHSYLGTIMGQIRLPLPSIDLAHPDWQGFVDEQVTMAEFRNRDLLFMQAAVHQLGDDLEFARQFYQQYPNDVRMINNLGVMLVEHHPNEANAHFQRALDIEPEYAPALYNLGLITGDHGKIEQAQLKAPWRVTAYQKYAPDKLWIVVPSIIREWPDAAYWSRGGFLLKGLSEILYDVSLTYYVISRIDLGALK